MGALAKSALIGTTIPLSLTLALLSTITPVIAVLIWLMIPGFRLAWGAGGMFHGTHADIFALGNAQLLVLVTIGNAIFYWCVSHFLLRTPRDG
jgi:hypothetical protein